MPFVEVAKKSDLNNGEGKVVQASGKEIALFNVNGQFFAIDNSCKHKGGPLGEGLLDDHVVTCPWHGWKFDIRTGKSVVVPTISVAKYNLKIQGDKVLVEV